MAVAGAAIAADALKYKGAGYVWGGTCSRVGDWDCSSFVSYVLGHDLSLSLPGGHWGDAGMPPNAHGPVVSDYLAWAGAASVTSPQAGDLCIFGPDVHIGIAIGNGQMISALNGTLGTTTSAIQGTAGGTLVYRRLTGIPAAATTAAAAANMNAATILAMLLVGGTLTAAFTVVALTALGAILAARWAIRQAAS